MVKLVSVFAPDKEIYRLGRGPDPFSPPEWVYAKDDGTFGNRFDDPTASIGYGPERRFRALYCATQRIATFGETLARFRVSLTLLDALDEIDDDESTAEALAGAVDPEDRTRGLIQADWRIKRRICSTTLTSALSFVDLGDHRTMHYLRNRLAALAVHYGIKDIDLSALMSHQRPFTQHCARHIYDLFSDFGEPQFAGIRYLSRLDATWECWSAFDGRLHHAPGSPGFPYDIPADDPDLLAIARSFNLTIEVLPGLNSYIRP